MSLPRPIFYNCTRTVLVHNEVRLVGINYSKTILSTGLALELSSTNPGLVELSDNITRTVPEHIENLI